MHSPRPREQAPTCTFVVRSDADGLWVKIGGEVDVANHNVLQAELDAIALEPTQAVHVDLRGLTFCDGRGCQIVLRFLLAAKGLGHELTIHGATPTIRRILTFIAPNETLHYE